MPGRVCRLDTQRWFEPERRPDLRQARASHPAAARGRWLGGRRMAMRLQLIAGVELLDTWAEAASQIERNAVYEALFSVSDGSAFLVYDVFGDSRDPGNFILLVKADLVLKVMIRPAESAFEIRYVGGLDESADESAQQETTGSD
jgi:hypothetical protein